MKSAKRKRHSSAPRTMAITLIAAMMTPALCMADPAGGATRYSFEPGMKSNRVEFESKAPLETFRGKTDGVSGFVFFDPENLNDSLALRVEIDMASFDTGLEIRNRHMRQNHLETDRFPTASFDGVDLVQPHADRLLSGRKTRLEIEGVLSLHGVKKKVVLPVDVIRGEEKGIFFLDVISHFDLKLSDYEIDRPKFLVMKLGDVQHIELKIRAVAGD